MGSGLHFHEEDLILPEQLKFLRKTKPNKQHFRIAIVNGYGVGFGDNFMGASAFRVRLNFSKSCYQAFLSIC
ncbi:MAG: hypothetical protein IJT59_06855 [Desulfovibrionaceae bacterium]|nr:hypothetical protein [Desulfovibrionaceae bacterium]